MKQILLYKGEIIVEDLPAPTIKNGEVLIKTAFSLISSGTELSGKKNGENSFLQKIISNPENIKKGINILKGGGIGKVLDTLESQKEAKSYLGYSLSGIVTEVGNGVEEFKIGDRVSAAGAGKANHAEYVAVPKNLVVKIPDNLDLKSASSVTLGAIAMQGLRRADIRLGDTVAVIGLGLLGQILIQLLKANGARVIGFDINDVKIKLSKELGLEQSYNSLNDNILDKIFGFTERKGADVTIITASAPNNNEIIQQAMEITRKKGKVVVVGDIGLGPKRSPFYEKEIDYLISTSYGPGRYDADYEIKGIDYPFAYVRWTEKRNMEEYLKLLFEKKINFQKLIHQVFPIEKAAEAYNILEKESSIKPAVLLDYHLEKESSQNTKIQISAVNLKKDMINVGVIGTGNFAKSVHLPNFKKLSNYYSILSICDSDGNVAKTVAEKFGAKYCTTNYREILEDKDVDMVLITLPHNLHAKIAVEALKVGKAVFCEKPMALNEKELQDLITIIEKTKTPYLTGFNRRFSPFVIKIKEIIKDRENPIIIDYQMNAGFLPRDHWTQTESGGGRNIGEACHIYDLFTYFTESELEKISAFSINPKTEKYLKNDNFSASLKFKDGSVCNLIYTAQGADGYPKEQMKIYSDGKIIFLDDYKELKIYGAKIKGSSIRQDKGHLNEIEEFAKSLKNGLGFPIPLWQLVQTTKISFEVEKIISKD
ncbi:MAG: Gfo/Idh/MocA family oxidoreductase [Candidatus Staskawiczbacteria bacterium]|nr:Gfo/Idh/MocA family oxidoreductase [Candidatus Staskawiczbacteria bacterium]